MVQHTMRPMVTWTGRDGAKAVTVVAVIGLIAAVVLRIAGLPRLDIHGPIHYLGIMDPGCGGTRAMYLLTTGDLAGAALYNPVVFPLAAGVLVVLVRALVGWTTGQWLTVRLPFRTRRVLTLVVLVLFIALWVRQQMLADLLMQPWSP